MFEYAQQDSQESKEAVDKLNKSWEELSAVPIDDCSAVEECAEKTFQAIKELVDTIRAGKSKEG
jgi:hypothetical protein